MLKNPVFIGLFGVFNIITMWMHKNKTIFGIYSDTST